MFSNLQIYRSLAKNPYMSSSQKTVSEEAMLREWEEIKAAQRDPARFRPLYDRYYEPIFRFVFRRCADEHLSADLCSQVFLRALQKLSGYTFQGVPFSAWLYRIAINEIGQYFRAQQRKRVVSVEEEQIGDIIDEVDLPHSDADQQRLIRAMDQLKDDDLQILELRFFEQRPFKEIAQILDITENNAKVRIHRVVERLRKTIKG